MKKIYAFYAMLIFGLMGCAGIGGTGGTVDDTVTPPKAHKVFKGKVSRVSAASQEFIVNGVQFKHTDALITRDAEILTENDLIAGQIITVEALDSDEDGVFEASKIDIEEQLLGPIELIDTNLNTVQIFGQTVYITDGTSFTDKSFSTLEINDYLAIFGFRREDGSIEATLIELLKEDFSSALDTVKVMGEVTELNLETNTITVDGIEIKLDENEIKNIKVGDFLSLENLELNLEVPDGLATNTSDPSAVNEVTDYEVDREIVIEGIPRRITSRNVFVLNGYQVFVPIEVMDSANIESVQNRQIIVEGAFVGDKELVAKSIKVEEQEDFELRGYLAESSEENAVLILGERILIDQFTFLNFDLEEALQDIELNDAVYLVYVKGYFNGDGIRVATNLTIKVEDPENNDEIKGEIESIEEGLIIVAGFTLRLKEMVEYENEDVTLESSVLLGLLSVGNIIEVRGEFAEDKVFLVNSLRNSSLTSSEEEEVQIQSDSIKK